MGEVSTESLTPFPLSRRERGPGGEDLSASHDFRSIQ